MAARKKIVEHINLLKSCGRPVDSVVLVLTVEAQGSACSQTLHAVWQVN